MSKIAASTKFSKKLTTLLLLSALALGGLSLSGCDAMGSPGTIKGLPMGGDVLEGDPITVKEVALSPFNASAMEGGEEAGIDISSVASGYVGAQGKSPNRLKLQVSKQGVSFNYDVPNDGTPIIAPINMGDGIYDFAIMQNTSENRYVELFSTSTEVHLSSEFEPYLRPNVFCSYAPGDAVVAKAKELTAGAANYGEALKNIYEWIRDNVKYDREKAAQLAGKTGYVPNPSETLSTKTGICFDYASLAAAMLRSIGVPTKIITGYVSPDGIYHAWNMIWLNGRWHSVAITVDPQNWSRIDLTFAAAGDEATVGDGERYEDRYVY